MEGPKNENNDNKKEADEESIISDRCWEEKYRGDSRKWLMSDGIWKKTDKAPTSDMKDSYQKPQVLHDSPNMGIRNQNLLKRFYEEASDEVIRETQKPQPVEEYCTEYDGNYNIPGFQPDDKKHYKNVELYEKYPLYASEVVSYWRFQMQKNPDSYDIPGLSKCVKKNDPFRRNSRFTKPITEVLDENPS